MTATKSPPVLELPDAASIDGGTSGEAFGKYELLERVGFGGMAEVYRARASGLQGFEKIVVVKKILPVYASNQAFIDMLIAEAKICSVLDHPNIVPIHDLGAVGDEYFLVMEYVHGTDLLGLLQACSKGGKRVPVELALYIISKAAEGLAYAHRASGIRGRPLNIIHRDVSPANIMLGYSGAVKVTDFGVARADIEVARPLGTSKGLQGKLSYMSPELANGQTIDHRSDIFALGVVLWEMLTLKRLFLGRTNKETLRNVREVRVAHRLAKHGYIPDGVRAIIAKALRPSADERFQSGAEMARVIRDYLYEQRMRVDGSELGRVVRELVPDPRSLMDARGKPPGAAAPSVKAQAAEAFDDGEASLAGVQGVQDAPRPGSEPEFGPNYGWGTPANGSDDLDEPYVDELLLAIEREVGEATLPDGPPPVPAAAPAPNTPLPNGAGAGLLSIPMTGTVHLKGGDGQLFGPVSRGNLERLVSTGAVSRDEQISLDGRTWTRIATADLSRLRPDLFDDGFRHVHEGPLGQAWIPRLFHQLGKTGVSGMLQLRRDWVCKEVFFRDGRMVHVHSNIKSELLASFLRSRARLADEVLDVALAEARAHEIPLGQALIAAGALTETDLAELLGEQLRTRFMDIFSWRSGRFVFYEGCQLPEYASRVGTDVRQLFGPAVRQHYELSALKAMFYPHMDAQVVPRQDATTTPQGLGLDDDELAWARTLTQGSGTPLARMVIDSAVEAAFWRTLFVLVQTDQVTLTTTGGDG